MAIINSKFLVETRGNNDLLDLTERVREVIKSHKLKNALVHVHTPSLGASIAIMEYDIGMQKDFSNLVNRIVPDENDYNYDIEWREHLAHTFMKSALIGTNVTVPFINGEFELERFQRILFIDFDGNNANKSVIIQMIC